jgi:probable addiction module antidote protein
MMGSQETTKFDSADYLNSGEAIAAYLDAYLEDSTPEELRNALATVARSHGISDLARRSGVSRPGIYRHPRHGFPAKYYFDGLPDRGSARTGTRRSKACPGLDPGIRSILGAMGLRRSLPRT